MDIHALAGVGITSFLNLCKGPVTQGGVFWDEMRGFPESNWMNTIPPYSSIPVEKLFLGNALQGIRHSGEKYHTVGRNECMTHLTLYEVLVPGIGAKTAISYI